MTPNDLEIDLGLHSGIHYTFVEGRFWIEECDVPAREYTRTPVDLDEVPGSACRFFIRSLLPPLPDLQVHNVYASHSPEDLRKAYNAVQKLITNLLFLDFNRTEYDILIELLRKELFDIEAVIALKEVDRVKAWWEARTKETQS